MTANASVTTKPQALGATALKIIARARVLHQARVRARVHLHHNKVLLKGCLRILAVKLVDVAGMTASAVGMTAAIETGMTAADVLMTAMAIGHLGMTAVEEYNTQGRTRDLRPLS
jgi:hypothetical protein